MDRMIHLALNSLKNLRVDQRINAQNLANLQVPGFKKDMPVTRSSAFLSAMDQYNSRIFVTADDKLRFSDAEGFVERTEGKLDFAIRGPGYFFINPNQGGEAALSRRGDFTLLPDGSLVDGANNRLLDNNLQPITLPAARNIIIDDAGKIVIEPFGSPEGTRQEVGILGTTLAEGVDLIKGPDGQIRPLNGDLPIADQRAGIMQGSLERSNVDSLEALLKNIEGQRSFELNVKFIKQAEMIDEATTKIMRLPG